MKIEELKTIDQNGLRTKIEERLAAPENYNNRPLIIWRSDFRDGVTELEVHKALHDYNRDKPKEQRKWFMSTLLPDDIQVSHDFGEKTIVKPGKESLVGLYIIEPMLLYVDYKKNPESLKKFHDLINFRRWGDIKMLPDVPVISFMSIKEDWFETPDAYPEAEQYLFAPDFEQWVEGRQEMLAEYIRGNGDKAGITYRWYNYFNTPAGEERKGCDYPSKWLEALSNLREEVKWNRLNNFSEIEERDFELAFPNGISADVIEGFRKYIMEQNG